MNAAGIFDRLQHSFQALVVVLARNQILEHLPFGKRDGAIINAFQLFCNIVYRSTAESQSAFPPYCHSAFFMLLVVFAGNGIDVHPLLGA